MTASSHTAIGGAHRLSSTAVPASRPAWVELLLTNGAASVPYQETATASPEVVSELLSRYETLPAIPFTNRAGIARALGFYGDERVVAMFRRTLIHDYRGLSLSEADGDLLCGLVVLMGHLAARYDSAFDFLGPGLEESYWSTNVTWRIARTSPMRDVDGDSPVRELVRCTIHALALSARDDAWQLVLERKRTSGPAYLSSYAGEMVDSAARRRVLLDQGRSYLMTNSGWELFARWAQTPEGLEWRRWSARIKGVPEP